MWRVGKDFIGSMSKISVSNSHRHWDEAFGAVYADSVSVTADETFSEHIIPVYPPSGDARISLLERHADPRPFYGTGISRHSYYDLPDSFEFFFACEMIVYCQDATACNGDNAGFPFSDSGKPFSESDAMERASSVFSWGHAPVGQAMVLALDYSEISPQLDLLYPGMNGTAAGKSGFRADRRIQLVFMYMHPFEGGRVAEIAWRESGGSLYGDGEGLTDDMPSEAIVSLSLDDSKLNAYNLLSTEPDALYGNMWELFIGNNFNGRIDSVSVSNRADFRAFRTPDLQPEMIFNFSSPTEGAGLIFSGAGLSVTDAGSSAVAYTEDSLMRSFFFRPEATNAFSIAFNGLRVDSSHDTQVFKLFSIKRPRGDGSVEEAMSLQVDFSSFDAARIAGVDLEFLTHDGGSHWQKRGFGLPVDTLLYVVLNYRHVVNLSESAAFVHLKITCEKPVEFPDNSR